MQNITLVTAIAGLVFGVLGAVLGLINTWRAFDHDRVRLLVVPRGFVTSTGETGTCFDITNLSYLAVTLSQVGIELTDPPNHFFAFAPRFMDATRLPHRMEARTSVTVFMPPGADQDPQLRHAGRAFAKTACGRTFYGTSPAFKSQVAKLRAT
jgi:hypothetical protein